MGLTCLEIMKQVFTTGTTTTTTTIKIVSKPAPTCTAPQKRFFLDDKVTSFQPLLPCGLFLSLNLISTRQYFVVLAGQPPKPQTILS